MRRAIRDEQNMLRSAAAALPDHEAAFTCQEHNFVIVVKGDALSCRLSPGSRVEGCRTCDSASDDAYAFIEGRSA